MNRQKAFWIAGLLTMAFLLLPAHQAWAGGGEEPPTTGQIVGPELWGVVVLDCSARQVVTLRAKRIQDCNVQTQAVVQPWELGCPSSATDPMYHKFEVELFDINVGQATTLTPIVTKVKNYKEEPGGAVFSFDVQIQFWQP